MTERTIEAFLLASLNSLTNERSIFSSCTGRMRR